MVYDAGVEGSYRFLRRVWAFAHKHAASLFSSNSAVAVTTLRADAKTLRREMHLVLKQVSYDYERMQYNTVVSGAMKMLNALEAARLPDEGPANAVLAEGFGIFLRVLYPVTPHIAQALWQELGYEATFGALLDAGGRDGVLPGVALLQVLAVLTVLAMGRKVAPLRAKSV